MERLTSTSRGQGIRATKEKKQADPLGRVTGRE